MMEHLASVAMEAETEQEAAEQFLPLIGMAASKLLPVVAKALAPAAKKMLPRIARAITRVTPQLTHGVSKIVRTLHRGPARGLLRTVPAIARRTVATIAKQAGHGRPVTPRTAVRTLAAHTRRVLGHPQHRRQALKRSILLDRRFHRHMGRLVGPGGVAPHHLPHHVPHHIPRYGHPGYYPYTYPHAPIHHSRGRVPIAGRVPGRPHGYGLAYGSGAPCARCANVCVCCGRR
jgi:hypothetical protein